MLVGFWIMAVGIPCAPCRGPIVLQVLISEIALRALIFFLFRRLISPEIRKMSGKDTFYLYISATTKRKLP